MASITISFDAGTSGSKIIASYPSTGQCVFNDENYFLVQPSIRQILPETYENSLENYIGSTGVSSSLVSYIEPTSGEQVYWEVGESASKKAGQLSVHERKFDTLLVKLLAFLGYLVKSSVKPSEQVNLTLGILLPLDEIGDRALLAKWLRVIIAQGFSVNGYEVNNINVEKINPKPEGYGIYKSNPSAKAGVLMLGHSDLSWLYFTENRFVVEKSRTFPGSGMHSFVNSIDFSTGFELAAAEILARAGSELDPTVLTELTQTKSNDELTYLTKAIKSAQPQYWADRRSEFQSLNIKEADSISAAGGAGNYFINELNQIFQEEYGVKLNWCKPLGKEFAQNFALKSKGKAIIPLFMDSYGYYKTLFNKEQIKTVPDQSKREKAVRVLEVVKSATKTK